MRIGTFNINGVVRRLPLLLDWLAATQPDAVCLQELKATDDAFPAEAIQQAGYHAVWRGEARWNGVAILSRHAPPVVTRTALPGDPADRQSRYIEAAVQGVLIGCLYAPNGNPAPGPKFDYKLAWLRRLLAHAATLRGVPAVLAGDYNVVPTDADIYNTRSWLKNALLQPGPRALYAELVAQGWTDALAHRSPPAWTFWSMMRQGWERDAGWRIDHLLVSHGLRITAAGVDRAVRGTADASDHAPAWVEVAAAGKA